MASELLKRSEVREEDTWKTSDMYENTGAWENELKEIITATRRQSSCISRGKLAETADNLFDCFRDILPNAGEKIEKAFNYAERLFDEDQTNTTHQAMSAKVYSLYAAMGSKTAFADPEIIAASDETLEGILIRNYRHWNFTRKQIAEIRRMKEHCLSAEMEKLLAMTAEMSQTPADTFSILNNADLVFPEIEDESGEKVRITHGRYGQFVQSADRRVQQRCIREFISDLQTVF